MSSVRRRAIVLIVLIVLPGPLSSQRLELRAGRSTLGSDFTLFSLGWSPVVWGPFSATGAGLLMKGPETDLVGGSADFGLDIGSRWRVIVGAAAGFASGSSSGDWAGWSTGLGWDLIRRPFGLGAEARYRRIPDQGSAGAELSLRVAIPLRPQGRPDAPAPLGEPIDPVAPAPEQPDPMSEALDARVATVVEVALATMGTPYLWGGSSANGFDCSGLIQHAYGTAGIALPRTSAEQARAGQPVDRELSSLRAGDILAFGSGSGVTHVGLYLGDGQFIHSSSQGVRTSRLSRDDPDGRWWLERWQGARRIIPES